MKKNYLLIIILFFISGCSVEYKLEFNDETINEKITIGKIDSSKEEEIEFLTPYAIYNDVYQELYDYNYNNQYLNLSYTYNLKNFESSRPFNDCYELSNISNDQDYYYILTSNEFKCLPYLEYTPEEVTIKFKSNHKIIETNADYVDNDTYIWKINEKNFKNKPISIKLSKETEDNQNTIKKDNPVIYYIISVILIIIVIVFCLHIKRRMKKNEL